ncbi:MAG: DNA repair protein RecO [Chloroflexota bacterium]|nr:DNA repair protein RecO [Chloroflexota bacterium]
MNERLYKTQAVVLRRFDFGEAGKQLVVYTPGLGKLSIIAQGVKRATSKLAGHLEPLSLSYIVAARGRNLDTVTQADTVEAFANARTDPHRVFYALLVAELLDKLTLDQEENRALWDLLVSTLRRIDTEDDPWTPATYFQVRLLVLSGYKPQLDECVECGGKLDPSAVFYSPRVGGTLCPGCRMADVQSFGVSANAVKLLRLAVAPAYGPYSRVRVGSPLRAEVEGILRASLGNITDREVGSAALLDIMKRAPAQRSQS